MIRKKKKNARLVMNLTSMIKTLKKAFHARPILQLAAVHKKVVVQMVTCTS